MGLDEARVSSRWRSGMSWESGIITVEFQVASQRAHLRENGGWG